MMDVAVLAWIGLAALGVLFLSWALYDAIQDRRWLIRTGRNGQRQIVAWASIRGEILRLVAMILIGVLGVVIQVTEFPRSDEVLTGVYIGAAMVAGILLVASVLERRDRRQFFERYGKRTWDGDYDRE